MQISYANLSNEVAESFVDAPSAGAWSSSREREILQQNTLKVLSGGQTQSVLRHLGQRRGDRIDSGRGRCPCGTGQRGQGIPPRLLGCGKEQGAVAKGRPLRAEGLGSQGENSVDIVIRDGNGYIVRHYQTKYAQDAEATQIAAPSVAPQTRDYGCGSRREIGACARAARRYD